MNYRLHGTKEFQFDLTTLAAFFASYLGHYGLKVLILTDFEW